MAYAIPQTTRISECSRPSWKLYYLHGALGLLNAYERLLGCISEASWRAIRCFWCGPLWTPRGLLGPGGLLRPSRGERLDMFWHHSFWAPLNAILGLSWAALGAPAA
eukprot:2764750-Pyramimonas_sp.AAC.2